MPFDVTMPDGTVIKDVPDGTTKADIAAKYQAYGAAPRGSAGALPEPVTETAVPPGGGAPLRVDVNALPRDQRVPDSMATLRGFGDTMLLNYADEIGSAVESGSFSGPEYDAKMKENADLRAADDPQAREAGQVLGVAGSMLVPLGAASATSGMGRQMLVGSGIGAGYTTVAGSGANGPGHRFDTIEGDALIGGTVGALAAPVASFLRGGVQAAPVGGRVGGAIDQTVADDAIRASRIDPNALRARAADFQAATGRGPRLVDILTPDEAQRFTKTIAPSPDARARVIHSQADALDALPGDLANTIQRPATGPAQVIGPAQATVNRRAADAANYGAAENTVFPLNGVDRTVFEQQILPYVTLPPATRAALVNRFENNALTGGDLVTARRALDRFNRERTNSGTAYEDLVSELDGIINANAPALTAARNASSANRAFTEGTEVGRGAAVPGSKSGEIVTEAQNVNALQQPGLAPGARSGLLDQTGNPRQSYALARELQTNPAYEAQLRATLPGPEVDALIAHATAQRQSIDNLGALARIPQDKMLGILEDTGGMTDAVVAAGGAVGGAFKAHLVKELLARVGVGRGPANRIAEDLLNPARRERAIRILESRGVPRTGARELVQGAFIASANSIVTADRPAITDEQPTAPSDTPAPNERPETPKTRSGYPDPSGFTAGRITSGLRSTEGNAAVGGVPASRHLRGDALDYVPAEGQSMRALEAQIRQYYGKAARTLNEGTHIHVTLPGFRNAPIVGARGTQGLR